MKSGTFTLGLTSVGQTGTGLADVNLQSQTVSVFATVFRKAAGELQRDGAVVASGGTLTLAAIREGRDPLVTGEEGRRSIEFINAIRQSTISGSEVRLPL